MRHVTHLIPRYVHGQLRMAQRAQVINHVRTCADCRAALARDERLVNDLRREMPAIGAMSAGQLTRVWAGVWGEVGAPRRSSLRYPGSNWLPGLSAMLAMLLLVVLALPVIAHAGEAVQAAVPHQALPSTPISPTPEGTDDTTLVENRAANSRASDPHTTIAYVINAGANIASANMAGTRIAGASPAPMPGVTASPLEVVRGQCQVQC